MCDDVSESTESSLTPYENPDLSMIIEDIEMSVTNSIKSEPDNPETTNDDAIHQDIFVSGVHFLTDESSDIHKDPGDEATELLLQKRELLEYLVQEDNTVICKWCGEVLPSRTHWYRHKYKFHVSNPGNLYKCYKCNAFFKSKKGYIGHVNAKHWKSSTDENSYENGDSKNDCVPALKIAVDCNLNAGLTNYKIVNNFNDISPKLFKRSYKSNVENIVSSSVNDDVMECEKKKRIFDEEYEKQRQKEEQLVADIINRVKRECEAQGSTETRRGYSRRTTVMNMNSAS